jgi:hypothetical protein
MNTAERYKSRIIQEYTDGDSLRTIGERYGISHETVSNNLYAWGVRVRRRGHWRKMTPEQITAMCKNYNGETLDLLAKKYDVCPSTISRIFKSRNIEISKKRKYTINSEAFNSLDVPTTYWLGYLYSRAFLRDKYRFEVNAPKDRFHTMRVNRLQQFLETDQPWTPTNTRIRFVVTCKELVDKLSELGVRPLIHLTYPKFLATSLQHTSFIRGYFDGRGTATRIVGGYDLDIVSNPQFLGDINKVLTNMTDIRGQKVDPKRLRYSKEEARAIAQALTMARSKTARTLPYSDSLARILKYHRRKRDNGSARDRQN